LLQKPIFAEARGFCKNPFCSASRHEGRGPRGGGGVRRGRGGLRTRDAGGRGRLGVAEAPSEIETFAAATAACNLEYVFNGHTVLEYLTGEVPRTRSSMASVPDVPRVLGSVDSKFLEQLQSLLNEQNSLVQFVRYDDARYSSLVREANSRSGRSTTFDLRPGDDVSYDGTRYHLLDLVSPTPTDPTKARIRSTTHTGDTTLLVKYTDLRPLATPRPVHMHTSSSSLLINDFVFFSLPDSSVVQGGIVVATQQGSVTVYECRQAPSQQRRFTPIYLNSTNDRYEAKLKPSACHMPVHVDVPVACVLAHGRIDNHYISASLFETLRSLGVLDE